VGITQRITVTASAPEGQRYNLVLYLTCLTGLLSDWTNSNRPFIDNVRKQLLIWRALPPSQKDGYIAKGREFSRKSDAAGKGGG
jgi:hypothetical protein